VFKSKQYRAKATEYGDLAETAAGSNQRRDFQKLARRFGALAHNEQWLADNYQRNVNIAEQDRSSGVTLARKEEHVLRCLGAALIMQWNALPTKLQRELFNNAGSMGELTETAALRGQIAHFLHGIAMATTQWRRSEQKLLTATRVHTRLLWRGGVMQAALDKHPNNEGRGSLKKF
jgi:hypothetical protein